MVIEWNKVTWYSKLIAVILFIKVLALGFYLGVRYERDVLLPQRENTVIALNENKVLEVKEEVKETTPSIFKQIETFRENVAEPFIVSGKGMEPTYKDGDYLIVDKTSRDFKRGEVIIHKYQETRFFIKRIIGLPNEHIVIKNKVVLINGKVLTEPYLPVDADTFGNIDITLGATEYFVMGDNRGASSDSRTLGPLLESNIVGKAPQRP